MMGSLEASWSVLQVLLALAALGAPYSQIAAMKSWAITSGQGVQLVGSHSTWAVRTHTEPSRRQLLATSTHSNLTACIAHCEAVPACTAAVYCGAAQGSCLADPFGTSYKPGDCLCTIHDSVGPGYAVAELASGHPRLATAAVKVTIPAPRAVAGYDAFLARSFLFQYELACPQDSLSTGSCRLPMTLEEAKQRCDAWAECQAFVFFPLGSAGITNSSFAAFKGSGTGSPLDLAKSSLSTHTVAYVQHDQLVSGGRSAAAQDSCAAGACGIRQSGAGVAMAAACTALTLAGGRLLWRRHQLQARVHRRPAKGSSAGTVQRFDCPSDVQVVDSWPNSDCRNSFDKQAGLGEARVGPPERRAGGSSGNDGGSQALPFRRLSTDSSSSSMSSREGPDAPFSLRLSTSGSLAGHEEVLAPAPPSPQWEDVFLPPSAVELCQDASGRLIQLGSGASGSVYRALLHGASPCACKVFKLGGGAPAAKRFLEEVSILWRMNNPRIVQFIGCSVTDDQEGGEGQEGYLLMELMAGGDLGSRLHQELPGGRGRWAAYHNKGRRVALQVAVGLATLHKQRLLHLDIKPANVLLTSLGDAKLGDVGFTRMLLPDQDTLSMQGRDLGTFSYCAPEVLLGEPASEKADVYSFGVLLFELFSGEAPVRGDSSRPLRVPEECPQHVADIQQRCLARNPADRPTAEEVVQALRSGQQLLPRAELAAGPVGGAAGRGAGAPGLAAERMLRNIVLGSCAMPSPMLLVQQSQRAMSHPIS